MLKLPAPGLCLALSCLLAMSGAAVYGAAAAAEDPAAKDAAAKDAAAKDAGDELRRAASAGDVAKVKELLAAGVDVNAANRYGGTALAFAADKGHTAVVELLLERGANINAKDTFYGATPLAWAVMHGHADIVRALLAKGAEGEAQALATAAAQGETAVVKAILERGKLGPEALSDALAAASQGTDAEPAERAAVIALLEGAGAKPPAAVAVDPAVLKSYEGAYEGAGFNTTVATKDGKLTLTFEGGGSVTLAAIDPATFRVEEVPGLKIAFQVEEGKVRGLTFDRAGTTNALKKKETP